MANPNPPSFADIVKRMDGHVEALKGVQAKFANHEAALSAVVVGILQRMDAIEMLMSGQITLPASQPPQEEPPEPKPALPPSGVSSAVGLASPVGAGRPALDELNAIRPNLVR